MKEPNDVAEEAQQVARVKSSGRSIVLSVRDGVLQVQTAQGDLLDPHAADVLIALGGKEPRWLRVVEGLQRAYRESGCVLQTLEPIAEVLGRKPAIRAAEARSTSDRLLLIALAAAGQPHVVLNPMCDITVWDLAASHRDSKVAAKARSLAEVLPPALAEHPDVDVRIRVARNPDCSAGTLDLLAQQGPWEVSETVAANVHTSPETLSRLATRASSRVLREVAKNPSTPVPTLRELAHDHDVDVVAAVVGNPRFPPRKAAALMLRSDGRIHVALAQRQDLSPRVLGWVERYSRRTGAGTWRMTRWRLAQNSATNDALHRRLERIVAARDRSHKPRVTSKGISGVLTRLRGALPTRKRTRDPKRIVLFLPPRRIEFAVMAALILGDAAFGVWYPFTALIFLAILLAAYGLIYRLPAGVSTGTRLSTKR